MQEAASVRGRGHVAGQCTLLEKDAAFSSTEAPMKAWGSSLRRKVDGTSAMRMSFLDGLLTGTPCKSWKQESL